MNKQRIEDQKYSAPANEQSNGNTSVEPPTGENSGMWGWLSNTFDVAADKFVGLLKECLLEQVMTKYRNLGRR